MNLKEAFTQYTEANPDTGFVPEHLEELEALERMIRRAIQSACIILVHCEDRGLIPHVMAVLKLKYESAALYPNVEDEDFDRFLCANFRWWNNDSKGDCSGFIVDVETCLELGDTSFSVANNLRDNLIKVVAPYIFILGKRGSSFEWGDLKSGAMPVLLSAAD